MFTGNFFAEDFAAHDAVADVMALLGRILFHSSSATTLQSGIKITCRSLKFLCGQRVLNTERNQREKDLLRLCSNEEMSKKNFPSWDSPWNVLKSFGKVLIQMFSLVSCQEKSPEQGF